MSVRRCHLKGKRSGVAWSDKTLSNSTKQPQDSFGSLSMQGDGLRGTRVLLAASELYATRAHHDRVERDIFAELARQYLPHTCAEDRRRIAEILADIPDAPGETLSALAGDSDPQAAAPILERAANCCECDLLKAIGRGPESLRLGIAHRADLTEPVITALFAHASAATLSGLLERQDLVIGDDALAAIAARPSVMAELAASLAARRALPSPLLLALFLDLDKEGRKEAIVAAEARVLADLARGERPASPQAAFKPVVIDGLVAAALSGGAAAFATHLSYLLGLPAGTAVRIVDDAGGEPLVACLRVLGIGDAEAARILVRLLGQRVALDGLRDLIALFDRMSRRAAEYLVAAMSSAGEAVNGEQIGQRASAASHAGQYSGLARVDANAPANRQGLRQSAKRPEEPGIHPVGPRREAG